MLVLTHFNRKVNGTFACKLFIEKHVDSFIKELKMIITELRLFTKIHILVIFHF